MENVTQLFFQLSSLFVRLFSVELLMDDLPLGGIKIPNELSFHWDVINKSLLKIQNSATYHFSMDKLASSAYATNSGENPHRD